MISRPFFLRSSDGGASFTSFVPGLPVDFSNGTGLAIDCQFLRCTAAGSYFDGSFNQKPIMFTSKNQGANWTLETLNLPGDFLDQALLTSVECRGLTCTTVGSYLNASKVRLPLIYASLTNGATWSLTNPTLPSDFETTNLLNEIF